MDEARAVGGSDRALFISDPVTLAALERRGLSLARIFGARGEDNEALAATPRFSALIEVVGNDLEELDRRPRIGKGADDPNHPFNLAWLRSSSARFDLIGIVHRPDRAFAEPGSCGEVRLVHRLVLEPEGRPSTALPMTVSLLFVVPKAEAGCAAFAARWTALPEAGAPLVSALFDLVRSLGEPKKLELNVQNLHGPSRRLDQDDHAEYLLRSFDVEGRGFRPRALLDTPRIDLSAQERTELRDFIVAHFDEIDRGVHVIPDKYLATRAISVAPRGLARARNRPFLQLFGEDAEARAAFATLPYEKAHLVRSPAALLRRLDQGTCAGCHESHGVAGFHLLGEERDAARTFNALLDGRSRHLAEELPWRRGALEAEAKNETYTTPRPFSDAPSGDAPRGKGARCGLGDPGFAMFACEKGLVCRDLFHEELGVCVAPGAPGLGAPCEDAQVAVPNDPATEVDGDRIVPSPKDACAVEGGKLDPDACTPNAYGFAGGLCSAPCATVGEVHEGTICADIPAAGYETECFPKPIPIEECLLTHSARRWVGSCDRAHPCRDDYACAKVTAAGDVGACVPPYFVFQARVDGPLLDR